MSSNPHPLDKISEFLVSFDEYDKIDNEYHYNLTIQLLVNHIKNLETTVTNLQTEVNHIHNKFHNPQYETILKLNKG